MNVIEANIQATKFPDSISSVHLAKKVQESLYDVWALLTEKLS